MTRVALRIVVVFLFFVALGAGLSVGACASARHAAVQVDATVAAAVFAVDDAEYTACQTHILSQADCDRFNPKIKSALESVRAVTVALQATPKTGTVPTSLPTLIQTLREVQTIALSLPPSAATSTVTAKVNTALDAAIALLSKIAGN